MLAEYRFGGLASVVHVLDLPGPVKERVEALALAGERLLDLDAEDFDHIAAHKALPERVVAPVRAARFPRRPHERERGSLRSLEPLYALMLEALPIRWLRREPIHVVVLVHLIAEYLPLLAWESVLNHAGDPLLLPRFVDVPGSRWGGRAHECDQNAAQRSASVRVTTATRGDVAGWQAYLDRYHSRVADALARCASHSTPGRPRLSGVCRSPCAVWTQLPEDTREDLAARIHLARMYSNSPVVELRHHAPVGHFFGVPSQEEIADAWRRTWLRLTRPWKDGANPLLHLLRRRSEPGLSGPGEPGGGMVSSPHGRSGQHSDGVPGTTGSAGTNVLTERRAESPRPPGRTAVGEPLPGLADLVSAVAGRRVEAGTVLRTIRDTMLEALDAQCDDTDPR